MSKQHVQNLADQIANKRHGSKVEDIQSIIAVEDGSIQLRAYQIHLEKGGFALDNWLEAERSLINDEQAVNSLSTANRRGSGGGG